MSESENDIPQIKPESLLDPPQIKLTGSPGYMEISKPKNETKLKMITKFKVPVFPKINLKFSGFKRRKRLVFGLVGFFVVVFLFSVFLIVLPLLGLYKNAKALENQARTLKDSLNSQDINIVKGEYKKFKDEFEKFNSSYKRLSWVKVVPIATGYYKDGEAGINGGIHGFEAIDIVIETIEPYADIIGFAGGGGEAKSGEDTANDRMEFVIQTIDQIIPRADELSEKARLVKSEVDKIDPDRYPEEFRGIAVQDMMKKGIQMIDDVSSLIAESKPLLESAPYLLGIDEPRTYLLLFQNDKELRPTGGFITAYSIIRVTNGKIEPVSSSDIYNLDSNYKPSVDAPEPIVDYIKGPYLISEKIRLRDMNWSPDFRNSMELFIPEAEKAGIDNIDGVIAVDTQVVVNLLNVIGPIGVSGYGDFSTLSDPRCNCPQVIYELESFADVEGPVVWSENEPGKIVFAPENYDNRKKIVGPLMNSVLSNALGQPKEKVPQLFNAVLDSVLQKHVLVYFFDDKAQEGAEGFNMAGRIENIEGDYLHINDANLGGRKSNLYVTQEVLEEVVKGGDGAITKTLTITYQNPQDFDGWLNSVLPNWTRIYVPKGAELISSEGFDKEPQVYEELGKTVFAGGFELRPKGVKKVVLKYKLPMKFDKEYKVLIQKQPGTNMPLHTVVVGKKSEEFFLTTDKELRMKI